ncbi:MAG: Plug domain-containing protein, partial [Gammaproteobacteria bacterium]|nr:Plug domain-containing protein [Gammaproteobacteria bacterium]
MNFAIKALIALSAVAVGTPVLAQGAALEEVVVTARKRAESLEDSPVSVTAFTSDRIESAGIETPADFIGLTPNITLVQTQNAGNSFVNIRGVSQARNSELSVAVLVDGVLLSNPAQFNQQLFDIEQIEVLRGPQGALYGRNAIGGAITINTRQPGDELEGKVEVGLDNGFGYT